MDHPDTSNDSSAGRAGKLVLLATDACSACDAAIDVLLSMPELSGHTLDVLEVSQRADWVERFGERVPVLLLGEAELGWPFDAAAVRAWLASQSAC